MRNKAVKGIIVAVAAVCIAALSFTVGFFTNRCAQSREISSYRWALETINKNYYFGGVEGGFTQTSLNAIADTYLDRYSEYYTAEEYKQLLDSNEGKKSGIGITYAYAAGKGIYISSVTGNSPADEAGMRAGEWIASGVADGKTVTFGGDDGGKIFGDYVKDFADGEEMTLNSVDGTVYTVAKSQFTASYTYLCTNESAWIFDDAETGGFYLKEESGRRIASLPDGTGYMRLAQFYGSAAEEFSSLVSKFNALGCKSLVLDLRTNGGGYVDVMSKIAGAFADGAKKPSMIARDKHGKTQTDYCQKVSDSSRRISKDVKIYVLANSGTASASEALIGAMVCYGALEYKNIFLSDYSAEYTDWLKSNKQEVKTAQSFGKGIMQSTFINRSTGEALKLTTAKIYWPDGKTCIHDVGLTEKDGCTVVKDVKWQHTKDDEELERVIDAIKD